MWVQCIQSKILNLLCLMKIKLLLALAMVSAVFTARAAPFDGAPNRYQVAFNADATRARVTADVWVEGNELALFGVNPTARFKNGQADFLDNISVRDAAGRSLALTDKGEGEYLIDGDRRVALSYDVRLDHGSHDWPGGAEEVAYRTDEGLMATGNALFLVPGVRMHGPTEVRFEMPAGWRAHTPWRSADKASTYVVNTRRELVSNALFFGTAHAESFKAGGIDLTLVMGKQYWPQRAVFMELIERQLASYQAMFGKAPLADRYLIVMSCCTSGTACRCPRPTPGRNGSRKA